MISCTNVRTYAICQGLYIIGQWGEFRVKNASVCLHLLFWQFFCSSSKHLMFLLFQFLFFGEVSGFRHRILSNQEIGIDVKGFLVEKCGKEISDSNRLSIRPWWISEIISWIIMYGAVLFSTSRKRKNPIKVGDIQFNKVGFSWINFHLLS